MRNYLLRFNWLLLLAAVALTGFGVVFVGSAGSARNVMALQNAWRTHAQTAVFGFALMFLLAAVDYRRILSFASIPFYLFSIVLLVAVLVFGAKIYGGRRWLWFFQPSEVAKLAVIMVTAQVFGLKGAALAGFKGVLVATVILVPPALLILAEPDLGTTLVLVPTVLAMLLAARVWLKGLVALLLAGLLAAGLLLGVVRSAENSPDPAERERIYSRLPLKAHQISRLRTFVNPDADPYGSGWNLRQARISIGSGSIHGKGVGKGEQKFLGYLPPSVSMNDFIFCVLAEETGFVGTLSALLLFLMLFFAGSVSALRCRDDRGRLLVVGALTLLFSHMYVNVAMSIGLMPITGLPLPFISAGKTFLVVVLAALGLVQSVAVHGPEELKRL